MKNIDVSNCYIVGDLHGDWCYLNTLINKKSPSCIIQTGDFGYWPSFDGKTTLGKRIIRHGEILRKVWYQNGIKSYGTPVYWCDGNHEDHWKLKKLTSINEDEDVIKVFGDIFYVKRGGVITTTDGRKILFMGGAESIDKAHRTIGFDWFPEEIISQKDIMSLPETEIDIVISHTCPNEFLTDVLKASYSNKIYDPCYDALSYVLEKYKPDLWYFGHFHCSKKGVYKNTKWTCLNMANDSGWFDKLEL